MAGQSCKVCKEKREASIEITKWIHQSRSEKMACGDEEAAMFTKR